MITPAMLTQLTQQVGDDEARKESERQQAHLSLALENVRTKFPELNIVADDIHPLKDGRLVFWLTHFHAVSIDYSGDCSFHVACRRCGLVYIAWANNTDTVIRLLNKYAHVTADNPKWNCPLCFDNQKRDLPQQYINTALGELSTRVPNPQAATAYALLAIAEILDQKG